MNTKMLFEKTLHEESISTKTYDIRKLLITGYLGGPITLIGIGTKNANWLKLEKWKVNAFILLCVFIQIFQFILFYFSIQNQTSLSLTDIRNLSRISSIIMCAAYYFSLRKNYRQHMIFNGEKQPILKDAIIWLVVSLVIEGPIMLAMYLL